MIEMPFIPNDSGEDCFRASLANLLRLLGDTPTSELVARDFWNHPLMKDSCSLFLLPRYVEDLTNGRYVARLHTSLNPARIRRMVSGQSPERRRATMEDLRRGRVICTPAIPLRPLSIVIVVTTTAHAAVYIGKDMFVDDGEITIYPPDQLKAIAVLTLDSQVGQNSVDTDDSTTVGAGGNRAHLSVA